MTTLLASKIPDNSMVIDLFCGAGTLSLGLLPRGIKLHAIDEDGTAISAFEAAAHQAGFGQQARFDRRNLFAAPLLAPELKGADTVILDPPRQGQRRKSLIERGEDGTNPDGIVQSADICTRSGSYSPPIIFITSTASP